MTSVADCQRVVAEAIAKFGSLDVLVNNAGRGMKYVDETFLTKPTRFWETAPDTWRMIIDTNVNGPFFMAKAAVPHMLAAGWGRIVNVSMSYETMKRPGFTPYGPSKAALESETIIWAQDLRDTGVTVNALLPGGPVATGMIPRAFLTTCAGGCSSPDIVVPALLWLASERSNGVHRAAADRHRVDAGDGRAARQRGGGGRSRLALRSRHFTGGSAILTKFNSVSR